MIHCIIYVMQHIITASVLEMTMGMGFPTGIRILQLGNGNGKECESMPTGMGMTPIPMGKIPTDFVTFSTQSHAQITLRLLLGRDFCTVAPFHYS